MKVLDIFEMAPLGMRGTQMRARDWIDSHQAELGTVAHFIDNGDEQKTEAFLRREIKDENLLYAVLGVLFSAKELVA